MLSSDNILCIRRGNAMFVTNKKYQEALKKITTLEREIEENNSYFNDDLLNKQKEFNDLKNKYDLLQLHIEQTNTTSERLEELKNQVELMNTRINDYGLEISTLIKRVKELQGRKVGLEEDIDKSNKLLNNLNKQILSTKTSLNKIRDEKSKSTFELNNLLNEIKQTAEDRYIKSTEIERGLLKELDYKVKNQSEQVKKFSSNIAELERQLINKEKILEKYIEVKRSLVLAKNEQKLQEVAFYKNVFPFTTIEEYKNELEINNQNQKEMIKNKEVVKVGTTWTVNGSIREGRKMTDLNIKLMIRSYNIDCDNSISSLKHSNFENVKSRIDKSLEVINNFNKSNSLSICKKYHELKLDELRLVYELKLFEQQEREKLKVLKEEERERKKVEQEIKEKHVEYNKREKDIEKQIASLHRQNVNSEAEDINIKNKIKELYDSLELIEKKREELEFINTVGKSGYVYIISNIGAFGKDIYKIGMTRRLEPIDRIRELSGAAVPFEYDIHALILTDDAPHLENHLHTVFNSNRVNLVNNRKEFFNLKLEEIKNEVFTIVGKRVVFEDEPAAKSYYKTKAIRNELTNSIINETSFVNLS